MPTMIGCQIDPKLERHQAEGFRFPLGVFPVEPMTPKPGYSLHFEPADGDEHEGEWEAWPDRYVFDIVMSSERVEAFCKLLLEMLPSRIYPIVDLLGQDAYREVDPYMAYEPVARDQFLDGIHRFRQFFYDDGMVGFGAMSEEPFLYIFVDEHKIVTVRAEPSLKDRIERLLKAFDLDACEDATGADGASHEHRTVLVTPTDQPDLLGPDEIVERLRDEWGLILNVDPDGNLDEEGKPLGTTPWRLVVRVERGGGGSEARRRIRERYAEVLLYANCLRVAEEAAISQVEKMVGARKPGIEDVVVVVADRLLPEQMAELLGEAKKKGKSAAATPVSGTVKRGQWLE
ncbi:MAG: hypothetical protein RL689_1946 [Planctomycetota bacterium]|jgi:hypothetical protein